MPGIFRTGYIQCLRESYLLQPHMFFSFSVSGQPASVNDVQTIRLLKPPKMKLFCGLPNCGEGLHIRGIISENLLRDIEPEI